jgi:hypothetical protein
MNLDDAILDRAPKRQLDITYRTSELLPVIEQIAVIVAEQNRLIRELDAKLERSYHGQAVLAQKLDKIRGTLSDMVAGERPKLHVVPKTLEQQQLDNATLDYCANRVQIPELAKQWGMGVESARTIIKGHAITSGLYADYLDAGRKNKAGAAYKAKITKARRQAQYLAQKRGK